MPRDEDWEEPEDLEAARRQRRLLVASVDEIKAQLTARRIARQLETSESSTYLYLQWRRRTIWALTNRLQELRFLNDWIKDHR